MRNCILCLFLLISFAAFCQEQPHYTSADKRLEAFQIRNHLLDESILQHVDVDNIGPTVFGGRITDLDVNPDDPTRFFVAYATGGLWYTENNGTTFTPVFDYEAVMTIGDLAVDWKNGHIWIGTGENNSSRSSYAGVGLYVSRNMGKSWQHMGLPESHHIGRILIHPKQPNTILVASMGHLYSSNKERGIYRSTDGGQTWEHVLFVNDKTGGIDLVFDPVNSNIVYASMWERERRAWNFKGSGSGSGIYKSTNAGRTWSLISGEGSGFPMGDGVGRIGLDVTRDKGKTVVYAFLDNLNRRPEEEKELSDDLTKESFKSMTNDELLNLNDEKLTQFLRSNRFPTKYTASSIKEMIRKNTIQPVQIAEYLEDANTVMFDTPVVGAEIYRSNDGGKSWFKTHKNYLDGINFSYGYYFGEIRASAQNSDKIYVMGVPIVISEDGGKTFTSINGENVHVDHHALWVNPNKAGHLINGNDGGLNISYDDGKNWIQCNTIPVGQFYYINVDLQTPYNVYGGLQDNGTWKGPHNYSYNVRWQNSGKYPYESLGGGDGMQVQIDSRDQTLYGGSQFGNYFRMDGTTGQRKFITPRHELGDRPYRWNWQSPILLSKHNQDILYMGANKLLRSMNKGDDFTSISPDLTTGGKVGDVPYGTLTTIDESPFTFGLLYTGSDDGLVHRSMDGGFTWENITTGLPDKMWVGRIVSSVHAEGRVYIALNGYRWDDFTPYVYMSDDYGDSWKSISDPLPHEAVNVIKEDPENEDILYIGTDHAVYISTDRGSSYMTLGNLPYSPVHDVVIHPKEGHLIIGTHGRSMYKTDIKPLRELLKTGLSENPLYVFNIPKQRWTSFWGRQFGVFRGGSDPNVSIHIYSEQGGEASMKVFIGEDLQLNSIGLELKKGIASYVYDLTIDEEKVEEYEKLLNENNKTEIKVTSADNGSYYLQKGKYTIVITKGDLISKQELVVE